MKISILTLFPEMFSGPFDYSIIKRAREKNLVEITFVNIRDFGVGKHKIVDDRPYGGGTGMIMKVDVLDRAIQSVKNPRSQSTVVISNDQNINVIARPRSGEAIPKGSAQNNEIASPVSELVRNDVGKGTICILLDARGKTFDQKMAKEFSELEHLILICGHYEGVDERVRSLVDETVSIGDFIITGGEIPAMLITDAVSRMVTGVLKEDATTYESFSSTFQEPSQSPGRWPDELLQGRSKGGLEYPQYTQPREYKGMKVPEILLSGNHKEIEKWKNEQAERITSKYRSDLLRLHVRT